MRVKRRSEEHTSELQSLRHLVCRLLLEKKIMAALRGWGIVVSGPNAVTTWLPAPGASVSQALTSDKQDSPHRALCSIRIILFFNDTATTEIYTLSLHDALPICLVVVLQRALHVALVAAWNAPVDEGVGIVRVEPDGLVVILQRALHVPFGGARKAPVVEGSGIVRLEPDGFAVSLLCVLHVAFGAARNSPVVEGSGIVRLEPDGFVVIP